MFIGHEIPNLKAYKQSESACLRVLPLQNSKSLHYHKSPSDALRNILFRLTMTAFFVQPALVNECYAVKCDKCGKTTWKVGISLSVIFIRILLMVVDAQTSTRDADNMSILCVFLFDKPFFEQSRAFA